MDSENLLGNGTLSSSSSESEKGKGGLRTMPFIIGTTLSLSFDIHNLNESLEKVASYGIMPNMILYLMQGYGMAIVEGTKVMNTWSAMCNVLSIFGAFISDSYLGRFLVISIGSFSSLLGLTMLWLTAMIPELRPSCEPFMLDCSSATAAQLAVLFISMGLISIGAGCIRPCSIAFGADQLTNKERSNDVRLLDSYFNWYYTSIALSTVIALSVIVYILENLGWKIGFGVPAVLMFISAVSFILGSPFYVKAKPGHSLLTSFVQVVVVAIKNRKLSLPDSLDQYYHERDSDLVVPTDSLRCLNKACIIRNPEAVSKPDGSVLDPWSQCTVGQVESLKSLLRVLPMWSTGIFMIATQAALSTVQANTMDRRLFGNFQMPAGSFNLVIVITVLIIIPTYDRVMVPLLAKYVGMPRGFSCRSRMGIGLLFVCASKATSAVVETMRRNTAIEEGFEDQPNAVIHMSVLWLVPEFVLLGIAEGFNPVGQVEFFYTYIPKSMSSFAMALFTLQLAAVDIFGNVLVSIVDKGTSVRGNESWLSTNINKGHLNYYYALLACLGILNYFYFLVICWAYGPAPEQKLEALAGKKEEQIDYVELPTS
ncbi:unnamed protein product [Sphenostylis stenocarpa]|uniref:Protein NRT1/ PTR FAMILY 1.2-like n=1 Tax=Sphenostylis stenocarpa TaxID=92480 RepID=A0AA86ST92_9FABA|nr:unnamed protein product [Sphenostylis stenocarpa]